MVSHVTSPNNMIAKLVLLCLTACNVGAKRNYDPGLLYRHPEYNSGLAFMGGLRYRNPFINKYLSHGTLPPPPPLVPLGGVRFGDRRHPPVPDQFLIRPVPPIVHRPAPIIRRPPPILYPREPIIHPPPPIIEAPPPQIYRPAPIIRRPPPIRQPIIEQPPIIEAPPIPIYRPAPIIRRPPPISYLRPPPIIQAPPIYRRPYALQAPPPQIYRPAPINSTPPPIYRPDPFFSTYGYRFHQPYYPNDIYNIGHSFFGPAYFEGRRFSHFNLNPINYGRPAIDYGSPVDHLPISDPIYRSSGRKSIYK